VVDIPGSTSTTASVAVGGSAPGVLETLGDHDWYRIQLVAGQAVTISLDGSGTSPVADPFLSLMNSSGNLIRSNDDGGAGLNSRIVFTPTTSGTYYIDVGSWEDRTAGDYKLSVTPYVAPPLWTLDQIAGELVSGYWGGETQHFAVSPGGSLTVNITALTGSGQFLARAALGLWSDVTGIRFVEVASGGQITFDDDEPDAFSTSDVTGDLITASRVNVETTWLSDYGTGLNSYSFQTYIHEIGHALGLGHAGDYNGEATYPDDVLYLNDSWSNSVMSYFSQTENDYFKALGFTSNYVLSPMGADIVAIASLYGVATTTRTGDTTYGFNSNAGRAVFDASQFAQAAYTIFDNGGIDTLDYSKFTGNQLVNLNQETFSNVGGSVGNVSIARGSVIENAIGGAGDDQLIGNSAGNVLFGGSGNDNLSGGAGNDSLSGGAGGDTLAGGTGVDALSGGSGVDLFRDTAANLNGDRITDLSAGERIIVSDGGFGAFSASMSGDLLRFTGGAVNTNGAPGGVLQVRVAAGGGVQIGWGSVGIGGDFNGDGREDVLWRNDAGTVTTWLGQSDGSFKQNGGSAWYDVPNSWTVKAVADFNGDGREDLLWQDSSGVVTNWLGQANGTFASNAARAWSEVPATWHVLGSGDFNGDGFDDVLWRSEDGIVTNWVGHADGSLSANASAWSAAPGDWHILGTGDFNGDGRDDVLWRSDSGILTNWLGQANGSFAANAGNTWSSVPGTWHVEGIGDFNGDNRDDVLWRSDDGVVTSWLGQASGGLVANADRMWVGVPNEWQIDLVGDFNGDHRDDVLWRHGDGTLTTWLGQAGGGLQSNGANFWTAVPADWQVQHTEVMWV